MNLLNQLGNLLLGAPERQFYGQPGVEQAAARRRMTGAINDAYQGLENWGQRQDDPNRFAGWTEDMGPLATSYDIQHGHSRAPVPLTPSLLQQQAMNRLLQALNQRSQAVPIPLAQPVRQR